jgi:hypothetical protein
MCTWRCLTNLKADCPIGRNIEGPPTNRFHWGSGLASHRSECVDITGNILLSYQLIGSSKDTCTLTPSNSQLLLEFHLDQSQCINCRHHWYCLANLKADWTLCNSMSWPLANRFLWGSGLANHGSEYVDITGAV